MRILATIAGLLAAVLHSLAQGAGGEAVLTPKALDQLIKLGLPDTRAAKWVHVDTWGWGPFGFFDFYALGSGRDNGNAWLVRKDCDGTVELIVGQARRVRVQKVTSKSPYDAPIYWPPGLDPTETVIVPKDLSHDLAKFTGGSNERSVRVSVPGGDVVSVESWGSGGNARALLFLAHLRQRGQTEAVEALWPKVMTEGLAERTWQIAVAELGEARLFEINRRWVEKGDAAAYAGQLQALQAEFPADWKARDAVRQLAERALAQDASAHSPRTPEAEEAARVLLAIRPSIWSNSWLAFIGCYRARK